MSMVHENEGTIEPTASRNFLVIGTGGSTEDFVKRGVTIPDSLTIMTFHRSMQYVFSKSDTRIDYWTWGDPDASLEGLGLYKIANNVERLPTAIVPTWFATSKSSGQTAPGSRVFKDPKASKQYEDSMKRLEDLGKVQYIPNSLYGSAISHKDPRVANPVNRFSGDSTVFGSVGKGAVDWELYRVSENKLTSTVLPICHYLGAADVLNLGFDNAGTRMGGGSKMHIDKRRVPKSIELVKRWKEDWAPHHKMSVYSIIPDTFTNLNQILKKKDLSQY